MPTYEYECTVCGFRLSHRQTMTEEPLKHCPECRRELRRLITGGTGFVMKEGGHGSQVGSREGCTLESEGRTCCGRTERCDDPRCRQ